MESEPSAATPESAKDAPPFWLRATIISAVIGVLLWFAWFALTRHLEAEREDERRSSCSFNLRRIAIALAIYQETNGCYPPAYIADENDKPLHSWRVLLLPLFGDPELTALYERYDFDEPWDGPNNRRLAAYAPAIYRCPSAESAPDQANYVAVVGAETIWPGTGTVSYFEMSAGDGRAVTVAVVETADSGINWLEPKDLTIEEAAHGIKHGEPGRFISSNHPGGANFALCDGRVFLLRSSTPTNDLRALLTRNGGEDVEVPQR